MLNPNAPHAIVEQCWGEHLSLRWWFTLKDEEGSTVYCGEKRLTKLEAMADRSRMSEQATAFRQKVNEGYASLDDPESRRLRVMLRAVYDTRDRVDAPGHLRAG